MGLHTHTFRFRKVLILMRNGTRVIDHYLEHRSGAVILRRSGLQRAIPVAHAMPAEVA